MATNLGKMMRLYRAARGITVRQLAPEIGTSPATISRIENGKQVDIPTYMRVLNWLYAEAQG